MGYSKNGVAITKIYKSGSEIPSAVYRNGARIDLDGTGGGGATYSLSNWVNSGDIYNGTEDGGVGQGFGPWMLISTPSTQEFQDERRCQDVLYTTTGRKQDQTRACVSSDGGSVSGSFCGVSNDDLTRTLTGEADGIPNSTRTEEECDIRVSTTPNPAFLDDFTFKDTGAGVRVRINDQGQITGLGSYNSGYSDAEGFSLAFTISLQSGQASSFTPLAAGASPVNRNIAIEVRGETPDGFHQDGLDFTFRESLSVSQPAPPAPVAATGGQFRNDEVIIGLPTTSAVTEDLSTNGTWMVGSSLPSEIAVTAIGTGTPSGSVRIDARFLTNPNLFLGNEYRVILRSTDGTQLDELTVIFESSDEV